jgi:hypothetical protein
MNPFLVLNRCLVASQLAALEYEEAETALLKSAKKKALLTCLEESMRVARNIPIQNERL